MMSFHTHHSVKVCPAVIFTSYCSYCRHRWHRPTQIYEKTFKLHWQYQLRKPLVRDRFPPWNWYKHIWEINRGRSSERPCNVIYTQIAWTFIRSWQNNRLICWMHESTNAIFLEIAYRNSHNWQCEICVCPIVDVLFFFYSSTE